MHIETKTNRYEFICKRARKAINQGFSLKLVKEYDDAVVAICTPPDSDMKDGVFLIPKSIFESDYYFPNLKQGYRETDPSVEDFSALDKPLPEKYCRRPIVSFFISELGYSNKI